MASQMSNSVGSAKPYTMETRDSEETKKHRVFQWLREHKNDKPYRKIKRLCRDLGLGCEDNKKYLWVLSSQFKTLAIFGLGSKCPNFHNWHGWAYVPVAVDRSAALERVGFRVDPGIVLFCSGISWGGWSGLKLAELIFM
jgi:hypothetical protein